VNTKEVAFMSRKFIQLFLVALFAVGLLALTQATSAQSVTPAANPTPAPLARPDYNYTESNGCVSCHFSRGAGGDHMLEAVGVNFDGTANAFAFSGGGWRSSAHSQSNYKSTQNTYCAKCHSPLQAKPEASFKKGMLIDTQQVPDGQVEGVTCAVCHPSHTAAVVLGRRLGLYQWGMDKTKPEAYKVTLEGEEDSLCLSCHVVRHNEDNAAFRAMYDSGVKCMDCHLAPYGPIVGTEVEKRFHDFKVAKNLPFSCGVEGSVTHCHPGMTAEGTLEFIPYMKQQHSEWWPMKPGKIRSGSTVTATGSDYMRLWLQKEAEVHGQK
jgi:hypothetical protein